MRVVLSPSGLAKTGGLPGRRVMAHDEFVLSQVLKAGCIVQLQAQILLNEVLPRAIARCAAEAILQSDGIVKLAVVDGLGQQSYSEVQVVAPARADDGLMPVASA